MGKVHAVLAIAASSTTATGAPPGANTLTVVGAATSTEAELPYTLNLLGPQVVSNDVIFQNGFD